MHTNSRFSFTRFDCDIKRGVITFHYDLMHREKSYSFSETVSFPPPTAANGMNEDTLRRLLESIHLMLGISYWKTFCPEEFVVPYQLSGRQAQFWETVYTKGLGEFYYRNTIDFRGLVTFPVKEAVPQSDNDAFVAGSASGRALVLLGGGKDSLVTVQLLKNHRKEFSVFTLNANAIHTKLIEKLGVSHINIRRQMDTKLIELNNEPGVYNGHVPISAIYAFTGILAAALYGYQYVIASNEASASYGNVIYLGSEINHQWSKSYEFELLFQTYIRQFITDDIIYFSLLRPFTEMHIVKLFSGLPQYFDSFTSCNRNFTSFGASPADRWCCKCPKCAFVFLLLAACLPKKEVLGIFGKNLFEDRTLLPIYEELLGVRGIKPFECVGTPREAQAAFLLVLDRNEYTHDAVVAALLPRAERWAEEKKKYVDEVFSVSRDHLVPAAYQQLVTGI